MSVSKERAFTVVNSDRNNSAQRILVTGGAGFLGSHLCATLLSHGKTVICLDNLHTGRLENIASLLDNPNFTFVEHDVTNSFDAEIHVDEIYNLASPASPPHYQSDPIQTLKTNVIGSMNILEIAKRHGARIFQASTSEVYGDPLVHPQKENYFGNVNSFGPRSCYDEGKRCAETLFFEYAHVHGVDVRIARIFNTYGPQMQADDGRVVSNFIVQALQDQDITVYGNGLQTRSFCYVDDLIEGFVRLMSAPERPSGPINLGNPNEFSVMELAELVIAMTGSRSRIVHRDLPVDDPRQRKPDISLARSSLGWEPRVMLREGLPRTIEYFQRQLLGREMALQG